MNVLELGIHHRLPKVAEHVDLDPRAATDKGTYERLLQLVTHQLNNPDLIDDLDVAVGNIIAAVTEAAYKIGIHDGYHLHDNVKDIVAAAVTGGTSHE